MSNQNKDVIGFALIKLHLDEFAVIDDAYNKGDDGIGLVTTLHFSTRKESRIIRCSVKFRFEQEQKPFLVFAASCDFAIEPDAWDASVDVEKKHVVFPRNMMAHLAMLTVGSARGMLHVKTENTDFNKFLLPTINVAEMIEEEDAVLDI